MAVIAKFGRQWNIAAGAFSLRQQADVIRKSGLFDSEYYSGSGNFDGAAPSDPILHFVRYGAAQGRKPNPYFEPHFYNRRNRLAFLRGWNPLCHYILYGEKKGRRPHPLFDPHYYAAQDTTDKQAAASPLLHFIRFGHLNRRSSHPLFDPVYYLQNSPGIAESGLNPLRHYLEIGAAKGFRPHRLFDPDYYLRQCPEAAGSNPLIHYIEDAKNSRFDPHPLFDARYYCSANPGVARSRINPLVHYVKFGAMEGRKPRPRVAAPLTLAERNARLDYPNNLPGEFFRNFNSSYVAVREGQSKTLDIVFSLSHKPQGKFSLSDIGSDNTQIFLNVKDNDSYQRGIPNITTTIDETARWLERVVKHFQPTVVRTMGESMGGYAALLFGHLLGADAIYASGPFARLGEPYCLSLEWYRGAKYDPRYQDISGLLANIRTRSCVVFPIYELFEYLQIPHFSDWSERNLFYCGDFHPGGSAIDWDAVIASDQPLGFEGGFTRKPRHPLVYTRAHIECGRKAYIAVRRRESSAALRTLAEFAEFDPQNYGIAYRLGVHQALMGDMATAKATLRGAMIGLWGENIVRYKPRHFAKWRSLIGKDYSNVVELPKLKFLVELFHEVWPTRIGAFKYELQRVLTNRA